MIDKVLLNPMANDKYFVFVPNIQYVSHCVAQYPFNVIINVEFDEPESNPYVDPSNITIKGLKNILYQRVANKIH